MQYFEKKRGKDARQKERRHPKHIQRVDGYHPEKDAGAPVLCFQGVSGCRRSEHKHLIDRVTAVFYIDSESAAGNGRA